MSKLSEILAAIDQLRPDARAVARRAVEHYEAELVQVTAHLSQIYEELMALYDVGGEISSTLDMSDIAEKTAARLCELLEAGAAAVVWAPEEQAETLTLGSGARLAPELLVWATAQALTSERSRIVNDFATADAPDGEGIRSIVTCPLRARGRLIGALHVLDKQREDGFSTQDQMLLETIASQVAVALDNSALFRRAERHAEELAAALEELRVTYDHTLEALSGALDLRDNETEGHARRVTRYATRIAREMGLEGDRLVAIERGALMHDLGKIGVPDGILLKPDKLTEEEWEVMRSHPQLGYNMIKNIRFLAPAAPIVLHHHERFDGRGYPGRLVGEEIPLGARIFAVADTFDAMTSDRPYRKALPYEVAREEMLKCAGSQFDPAVAEAFCRVPEAEWERIRADVESYLAAKRGEGGAEASP